MPRLILHACTSAPFGAYLKALGIFRLVSEQRDPTSRGYWSGDTFVLETSLDEDSLAEFFLNLYEPTPIVAPWNGSSGFYDRGIDAVNAILNSTSYRFQRFRSDIAICRSLALQSKEELDEQSRAALHRQCRNLLSDQAVEWLDAVASVSSDGRRFCAPILGTGGNDGNLEFSNNFMARLDAMLIAPSSGTDVRELLVNALFGGPTAGLQDGSSGQFDPGRAGGANQGPRIEDEAPTNPWDLILTIEGAVTWASGLYRRQGAANRGILCSPFTVHGDPVGYGSASTGDDVRAEIWTPLWEQPAHYSELRILLREGRASIQGRPAKNTLEFAEAVRTLGIDRSIQRFVRYSLLVRRGKSYVALPTGTFATGYKSEADFIRELQTFLDSLYSRDLPKSVAELRRDVDTSIYQVLLLGGRERMCDLMAAFGHLLRRITTTTKTLLPRCSMRAADWIIQCGYRVPEVRIASALASIYNLQDNLSRSADVFAWSGRDLPERLRAVLIRRMQMAEKAGATGNPLRASAAIHPGDATLFIEGSVDDALIEDLLFAFTILDWSDFESPKYERTEVLPVYAVIKHLFLPVAIGPESKTLRADPRILSLLASGDVQGAAKSAVNRLRVANLRPLEVTYSDGPDGQRLAASLLIPVWSGKALSAGLFHEPQELLQAHA